MSAAVLPTRPTGRVSDPRRARRSGSSPSQRSQTQTKPQDLPRYKEPAERGMKFALNLQHPPGKPPRSPGGFAIDKSRETHDKLEQFKRGLNDLVFPGLNEVSDFIFEEILRFIK